MVDKISTVTITTTRVEDALHADVKADGLSYEVLIGSTDGISPYIDPSILVIDDKPIDVEPLNLSVAVTCDDVSMVSVPQLLNYMEDEDEYAEYYKLVCKIDEGVGAVKETHRSDVNVSRIKASESLKDHIAKHNPLDVSVGMNIECRPNYIDIHHKGEVCEMTQWNVALSVQPEGSIDNKERIAIIMYILHDDIPHVEENALRYILGVSIPDRLTPAELADIEHAVSVYMHECNREDNIITFDNVKYIKHTDEMRKRCQYAIDKICKDSDRENYQRLATAFLSTFNHESLIGLLENRCGDVRVDCCNTYIEVYQSLN